MQQTFIKDDNDQKLSDLVKMLIWTASYVSVLIVMIVLYFKYKREKAQM